MDPNANVSEQWEIVRSGDTSKDSNDRLMELREAYIAWRGRGGFRARTEDPPSIETMHAAGFQIYQPI